MPIAPSMQRFVDDELARSVMLVQRTLTATAQALLDARPPLSASVDRDQRAKLIDALRRQAGPFGDTFVASLRRLVSEALREQHDDSMAGTNQPRSRLELMDESRVEVDIEVSRATQVIDAGIEWELRELQTLTSTLAGQTHVTADTNPLRPVMYAKALWDAAGEISSVHGQRAALLRVSAGELAGLLKLAFAAACTRLESQGIEPGLYRTAVLSHGPVLREEASSFPSGPFNLLNLLPTGAESGSRTADGSVPASDHEAALLALDALAARLPDALAHRDDLTALRLGMAEQRVAVRASANANREVVDLTSRLFEAMLADSQLNPAVRALLARFEVSALRVAARDDTLPKSYEHPLWQFVNRIGDLGQAYPQASDPRLTTLLPFCGALADEVAQARSPDANLCRRGLARLDTFLAEQLQWQLKEARATLEALRLTEQRDLLEAQLAQRLANEVASVPTTPAMRSFVVGSLAKVLAEAMLRFGHTSEATNAYLKLVDDLLWSLAPPDHPQSRQRLASMLPDVLQRLRRGMALISLPHEQQQAVLDDLMIIHTEAMRPGTRGKSETIQAEEAAEIVRRMRDESLPSAPGGLPDGDAVIDFASMQTVPAELLPDDPPVIDSPARKIDALQPGGHYRLFLHGRWSHTQLLWRSPQGRLFLFAGENPARPHSITRRALERLNEAGLARLRPDTPLVIRASETLQQQLAPHS